jgi:hypothetical protein
MDRNTFLRHIISSGSIFIISTYMKYTIPPPRYKLNIVESGVKHYKPNPKTSNGNIVESGVKHHNPNHNP